MLQNLAWQATDELTRAQLRMFHTLGDEIRLTEHDRRRALNLDAGSWTAWTDFLSGGPLPAEPPLPAMLHRIAESASALTPRAG